MKKYNEEVLKDLILEYNLDVINTEFDKIINLPNYIDYEDEPVKYTDTDSQFLISPLDDKSIETIEYLSNLFAKEFGATLNSTDYETNDMDEQLLTFSFKNEFKMIACVFYAKKSYIALTVNDYKEKYEKDDIDVFLTGVEGKKGAQKIVERILYDFIDILKTFIVEKRKVTFRESENLVYSIIEKYYKEIDKLAHMQSKGENLTYVVEELGLPINIGEFIENLENVSSYYRGTITFDTLTEKRFPGGYQSNKRGRSRHLYIQVKDEKVALEIYKNMLKYKNLAEADIKDLTIPEEFADNEEILRMLYKYTFIDVSKYKEIVYRKILRLFNPLFKKLSTPSFGKTKNKPYCIIGSKYICLSSGKKKKSILADFKKHVKSKYYGEDVKNLPEIEFKFKSKNSYKDEICIDFSSYTPKLYENINIVKSDFINSKEFFEYILSE